MLGVMYRAMINYSNLPFYIANNAKLLLQRSALQQQNYQQNSFVRRSLFQANSLKGISSYNEKRTLQDTTADISNVRTSTYYIVHNINATEVPCTFVIRRQTSVDVYVIRFSNPDVADITGIRVTVVQQKITLYRAKHPQVHCLFPVLRS